MSTSKAEGKRSLKEVGAGEEDEDDEEDIIAAAPAGLGFGDDDQKIKDKKGSSTGMPLVTCQADGCAADLTSDTISATRSASSTPMLHLSLSRGSINAFASNAAGQTLISLQVP